MTSIAVYSQNIVSGELTGTLTDPSGAVLSNVPVTLKSQDTGQTITTTTSNAGFFRFALLRPGTYTVSANPVGFSPISRPAIVSLGQVTSMQLKAALAGQTTTVEVSAATPLLQTENGNVTSNYNQAQLTLLPAPGNDMTNYALTAPGVTLSTGAGYGNFSAFGLPGTSNLYTVNGSDNNDPFNGLNNSGASNNTLGTNELQEMTIVTNGYTGQYGRSAGANINYSTKSGTNSFHGNAEWEWNGRYLNANDWFNNNAGTPRPFANSNMWMGAIGGPIKKDKLFFFYDNEGMRYVLPGSAPVYVPSPQFEAATLANIPVSEIPFYTNMFNIFNHAIGVNRAVPVTANVDPALGCGGVTANGFGTTVPCALTYQGGGTNKNTERLMALKIDLIATQNDKLSFRWWEDRGLQATYTDPINSIFNAQSNQPQDQGQLTYTRVIGTHMTNQFIAAGSHYSAIFNNIDRAGALAAFPTTLIMLDGVFASGTAGTALGGETFAFPQGRNVTQYQFVDDFSWTKGNHDLKFGVNIRRDLITDLTPYRNTTGELELTMADLYAGLASPSSVLVQRYDTTTEAGFSLYSLGLYAQDEWRVSNTLKLTLSLRADRNSNTSCKDNCFTRFTGPFVPQSASVPYNQSLISNESQGLPGIESVVWEPRIGFAFSPWSGNTVFRGGIGLFADLYPAQLAEPFASNPPYTTTFNVAGSGTSLIDPSLPGSLAQTGAAGKTALVNGYLAGQTVGQISSTFAGVTGLQFPLPTVTAAPSLFRNPKYLQWNFEIERALGDKMALTLNYVGNHGYDAIMQNPWVNSYCLTPSCLGYAGLLPTTAPDLRFGRVVQYTNNNVSNYNGLSVSLNRRMSWGFAGSISYTWSHSLDYVSNGDIEPYTQYYGSTYATSILTQMDPLSPRHNYGDSDYDFRHNFSANYIWQIPFKPGNTALNAVAGGWSVSGTFFARSGMGYTPYVGSLNETDPATGNSVPALGNAVGSSNAGNILLASFTGGPTSCSGPSPSATTSSCLTSGQFAPGGLGNYSRNAFRGPMYFNTDMSILKKFKFREHAAFTFGANFYNILNHPNFLPPNPNLSSSTFGQLQFTATPPSSPYGNFQGAAVSGRIIQSVLKLEF